ncbi:hypothetical protein BAUCODRAFT_36967 [Baudoinia panamericana UAMH 10762]|uniref:Retinol dehydrogenase 12 n=1 Tax=Baudoinia panamericana (strain UAMH 10762) TaxID=717646 RepID=M2LGQ9_BAUPA|nr:uncharacterized protein BAUCODRAFT_36967 [Baudoinia panamericana UAMH 10762]EMC93287.1 hypothetical protein BAUCODRAFT_36967 [Baudoinia panamericana UAMH 10762]
MFRLSLNNFCRQSIAATTPLSRLPVQHHSFTTSQTRHASKKPTMSSTVSSIVENVQTTLSENFGRSAQAAAPTGTHFSLDDVPDQTGKVAVITGGSEGIGYGSSHTLLSKNISKIFIISLSKEVVEGAKKSVAEELGQDKADRTHWYQCDMGDWKKVAEVSREIAKQTDRVDILINNAARGIMTYQLTDYGVDRHMAVNHMGHVILTSHLLPLMKKTASNGSKVRIVNFASNAHESSPKDTQFKSIDDLNKDLGAMPQYGRAKLTSILYSKYLNRHLTSQHPNILANAVHPGVVKTKMSQEDIHEPYPLAGYMMSVGLTPFKKDQFEGALSCMYAATVTTNSGEYICPPATVEPGSDLANNEQLGEDLMKLTRDLITEKTKKDSVDKGCPMKDY